MAFHDNPKSDKSGKNSQKSLLMLQSVISLENGFATRTVTPDYGVDENVELLYFTGKEYTDLSGKHFALQLKSVDTKNPYIKKIGKDYIKLQFETSRLGYLLRNELPLGVVIVYDVKTSTLYYEYAEDIYNQLTDIHNGESWKVKKSVTIYLNKENIFNKESAKKMHDKMFQMHQQAAMCLKTNGQNYGLKSYDDNILKGKIDYNDPKVILEQLDAIGWKLIHEFDVRTTLQMLEKINQKEIFKSSKFTAMAATAYWESGQYIEANFHITKYYQLFDSSDKYYTTLEFLKYKTDFALGNLNYSEYKKTLERLEKTINGESSKIIIKINLLLIKILSESKEKKHFDETLTDIKDVIQTLMDSNLESRQKFRLSAQNIQNIIIYFIKYITHTIGDFKTRQSFHARIPKSEIDVFTRKYNLFDELISETLYKTNQYATFHNDTYLKASTFKDSAQYFLLKNFNAVMLGFPELLRFETSKEIYELNINMAFTAWNLFEGLGRYKDAYASLNQAHELTALYFYTQGEVVLNELSVIENTSNQFAEKYLLSKYIPQVIDYFTDKKNDLNLSDEILDELAEKVLNEFKLPKERKLNILSNLKDIGQFSSNDKSINFHLLENLKHRFSPDTHFKEPITYRIACKRCEYQSPIGKDINVIISYMDKHECKAS